MSEPRHVIDPVPGTGDYEEWQLVLDEHGYDVSAGEYSDMVDCRGLFRACFMHPDTHEFEFLESWVGSRGDAWLLCAKHFIEHRALHAEVT